MNSLVRVENDSLILLTHFYNATDLTCTGPDRFIDIIDCEKQVTYKMSFDDYIEYFESFERDKIYNVLSLEISNTK
jgi:hypothetical protein